MPKHLVISTSGNPDSNSRRMGRIAFAHLQERKIDCDWIDIREMDLPLCDADKCYGMPGSKNLHAGRRNRRWDNHRRAGLQLRRRRGDQEYDRAHRERMARQDRRFSLRRGRHGQLHVGNGVCKQSDAGFSVCDYSAVCVRD